MHVGKDPVYAPCVSGEESHRPWWCADGRYRPVPSWQRHDSRVHWFRDRAGRRSAHLDSSVGAGNLRRDQADWHATVAAWEVAALVADDAYLRTVLRAKPSSSPILRKLIPDACNACTR